MSGGIDPVHAANCERLARLFEGREAIYIEKGIERLIERGAFEIRARETKVFPSTGV